MNKLFFLALALLLFSGKSVFACMCGNIPSVWEARENAKVVFLGKAISSEYQKGAVNGSSPGEELAVRFKVERWWKGKATDEIIIFADQYRAPDQSISISTCGMEYRIGTEYLIYAVEYNFDGKPNFDGKLRAAYCSRSSEREGAKKDLKKLGKGYKQEESKTN